MHYCAECDQIDIFEYLVNTLPTASIDVENDAGETPWIVAVREGKHNFVSEMLTRFKDVIRANEVS